jgi:hypothetical protein
MLLDTLAEEQRIALAVHVKPLGKDAYICSPGKRRAHDCINGSFIEARKRSNREASLALCLSHEMV